MSKKAWAATKRVCLTPHPAAAETEQRGMKIVAAALYVPPSYDDDQLEDTLNRLESVADLTHAPRILIVAGELNTELERPVQ